MKKSILSYSLFVSILFSFTAYAQPQVGNRCSGETSYWSYNLCSNISLENEDKNQAYTYAISFMNVGHELGCIDNSYNTPPGTQCRGWVRPGETVKLIIDSHFCSFSGEINLNRLGITSNSVGHDKKFIDLMVTEVSVIKSTSISNMHCSAITQKRNLIEIPLT